MKRASRSGVAAAAEGRDSPRSDAMVSDTVKRPRGNEQPSDEVLMELAISAAAGVRATTAPNPWVGCVVSKDGQQFVGATSRPGGPHAEIVALGKAGSAARGSTLVTTLEPCAHRGRTGPCTDAIVDAGVGRVVVGIRDPDAAVDGAGVKALGDAGIPVTVGVLESRVAEQLRAYRKHRITGRPYVVLKLAATLDGRIAAPDGSSRWITGPAAREEVHRLRAESDAVLVGAGTVARDDPALTVRLHDELPSGPSDQPLRVVLTKHLARDARAQPAIAYSGPLDDLLDELGGMGILQLLVEGGARVAYSFHHAGLVDRYVIYIAPVLLGGSDGIPLLEGSGAPSMSQAWRGQWRSVTRVGDDLRVEMDALGAWEGLA